MTETVTLLGNNLLEIVQLVDLTLKHLIIYQTDFNINLKKKKMKKIFLISFLLLSCTLFYGQGTSYNLGFSQVLNLSFSGNYSTNTIDHRDWINVGTLTVPSNKVHKITNGSSYLLKNSSQQVFDETYF